MDVTIQHLRSFIAVADEGSFTRAAQRLLITTPALSQQIALIERRMSLQLFHRGSRAVTLTEAGAALVPRARAVLVAMDEVLGWAKLRSAGDPLRIGVPDSWSIVSLILEAHAASGGGNVVLQRISFTDGLDAIRDNRIDIAFVPALVQPSAVGVDAVPLWVEPRLLVVSARHPLAERSSVTLDETNRERFVSFGDVAAVPSWYVVPRPDGSIPRIDPIADSYEGVLDLCAAGMAVHIVGAIGAASHQRPDLCYVPISDAGWSTTWLVLPRRGGHPETMGFLARAREIIVRQAEALGIKPVESEAD